MSRKIKSKNFDQFLDFFPSPTPPLLPVRGLKSLLRQSLISSTGFFLLPSCGSHLSNLGNLKLRIKTITSHSESIESSSIGIKPWVSMFFHYTLMSLYEILNPNWGVEDTKRCQMKLVPSMTLSRGQKDPITLWGEWKEKEEEICPSIIQETTS